MFERNRIGSHSTEPTVLVPVEVSVEDGEVLKGTMAVAQSKTIFQVLNDASHFVHFEAYGQEPRFIAKMSIRSVKPVVAPRADSLKSALARSGEFDPHGILGVKPDASWDDVRQAYRNLAKTYHPDRFDNVDLPTEVQTYLSAMVRRVTEAYSALEQPQKQEALRQAQVSEPIYCSAAHA